MEIKFTEKKSDFSKIKVGTVFSYRYSDDIYLKINEYECDEKTKINAVGLINNKVYHFNNDIVVTVLPKAFLTV